MFIPVPRLSSREKFLYNSVSWPIWFSDAWHRIWVWEWSERDWLLLSWRRRHNSCEVGTFCSSIAFVKMLFYPHQSLTVTYPLLQIWWLLSEEPLLCFRYAQRGTELCSLLLVIGTPANNILFQACY